MADPRRPVRGTFRLCATCARTFRPPFGTGWATGPDGSWVCPGCCGRAEQEESERVAALVDVARSHQPFTYWRRAAIERIFIDIVADLRREGWKLIRSDQQ
jgi:hypothetical protein